MNQKVISFNTNKVNHYELQKLYNDGYRVICPLCKSDIFFSNAGSWCSKNSNHYETHIYGGEGARRMRERAKANIKKEAIEYMKKEGYTQEQIQEELNKNYKGY